MSRPFDERSGNGADETSLICEEFYVAFIFDLCNALHKAVAVQWMLQRIGPPPQRVTIKKLSQPKSKNSKMAAGAALAATRGAQKSSLKGASKQMVKSMSKAIARHCEDEAEKAPKKKK